MGFEIKWYLQKKIIHADIIGKVSIDDVKLGSQTAIDMFNQSNAPLVHVLANESNLESLPISLNAFSEAATFMRHPQIGWLIMYGTDNRMSKFMSSMLSGIAKVRHRRFETLEQSLEFLTTVDTSLPPIEEMLQAGQG